MTAGRLRLLQISLALALLLLWALAAQRLSTLVLPSPLAVLRTLAAGLASGYLWPHLVATVSELLLGLLAGGVVGFAGGLALAESATLRKLLLPYVVVSQVVPKLALMPLLMVWFGLGLAPTVVVTALICFFPLLENTLTGVQLADPPRLELFRMLGASRAQTLWRLKLPAALPLILAGARVAVVLALVGAVVGEFISASRGLGALIIAAQGSMDTALMFAVLMLIAGIGLLMYAAVGWLERRLLRPYATLSEPEPKPILKPLEGTT